MLKNKICIFERDDLISDSMKITGVTTSVYKDLCTNKNCRRDINNVTAIVDMYSYDIRSVTSFLVSKPDLYMIVVNAKESIKYQLYECGAADVMTGTLDKMELQYKVLCKIRLCSCMNNEYYLGDILYNTDERTLEKNNESMVLPSMQNKIFTMLIRDYFNGTYLQKDEIFDSMVDESERIQNHIARLRYSLSCIGSQKVSIETIYGRGYRLKISE